MLARRFLRKNGGKLEARPEADRAGLCQPARLPANTRRTRMKAALALFLCAMVSFWSAPSTGQQPPALSVKPVVEKRLKELPQGPLFWRIETLPTLAEAQTAAGPTALAAEISGKVWLFTLGSKGGAATPGAAMVAEIGPVPPVQAPEYLLRINHASGPPG